MNNFAISSEGIGEALERSAASLVEAGNSLDQSIGLIAAGNLISQDPENVGNAIKVLSLRIRGAKSELEELGEETDTVAVSTSKLRNEIKALTGVDIMIDDSTFKSTYDIMLEISKIWSKLSDVSQANVLEKLAGKTRASVIAGLLQNMQTAQEASEASANSSGSAFKENEKVLDSVKGKLTLLNAEVQKLWSHFMDSSVLKTFIELGTILIGLIDKFGLLKSVAVGASVVLSGMNKGFFKTNEDKSGITSFISELRTRKPVYEMPDLGDQQVAIDLFNKEKMNADAFAESIGGLDKGVHDYLKTVSSGEATMADCTKYINESNNAAKRTTAQMIGAKVATGLWTASVIALNAALSIGLSFAIQGLFTWIDNLIHKSEKLIEKANDAKEVISELNSEFKTHRATVEDVSKRYAKLKQGVSIFDNTNLNLTTDDYQEFLDITDQLADMFPTLIKGYDSNGHAILALDGNVNTIVGSLSTLIEKEERLTNLKIVDELPTLFDGAKEEAKKYGEELDKLKEKQVAFSTLPDVSAYLSSGDFELNTDDKEISDKVFAYLDKLKIDYHVGAAKENGLMDILFEPLDLSNIDDATREVINNFVYDIGNTYETKMSDLQTEIADTNTKVEAVWNNFKPNVQSWLATTPDLDSFSSEMKTAISTFITSLDLSGYDSIESVETYITDSIIAPLKKGKYKAEGQKALLDLLQMPKDSMNLQAISQADEYLRILAKALNVPINADIIINLRAKLGITDAENLLPQNMVGAIEGKLAKVIANAYIKGFNVGNALIQKIKAYTQSLDGTALQVAYEIISDPDSKYDSFESFVAAIEKGVKAAKKYSPITITSLFAEDSDFNTKLDTYQTKLTTLSEVSKKLQSGQTLTPTELADLLKEVPELANYVDNLEYGVNKLMKTADTDVLEVLDEQIKQTSNPEDIEKLEAVRDIIAGIKEDATQSASGVLSISDSLTRLATNKDLVKSINQELRDLGYISADTLKSIVSEYPGMEEDVANYLLDHNSSNLLNKLKEQYKKDFDNYALAVLDKKKLDADFYDTILSHVSNNIIKLAKKYGINLKDYKNYLEAKLVMDKEYNEKNMILTGATIAATMAYGDLMAAQSNPYGDTSIAQAKVDAANKAKDKAQKVLDEVQKVIDAVNTSITGNLGSYGGVDGNAFSQVFDWIEIRINKLRDKAQNAIDSVINYLSLKNKDAHIDIAINAKLEERDALNKALKKYNKKADAVPLSQHYKDLVDKGGFNIETVHDETVAKNIEEYQQWTNKANETKEALAGINQEILTFETQKLDEVSTYYDSRTGYIDSKISKKQAELDIKEAQGKKIKVGDYQGLVDLQLDKKSYLQKEYDKMNEEFKKLEESDSKFKYSPQWYQYKETLVGIETELINCDEEIETLKDSANEVKWKTFDTAITKIDNLKGEISDLQGLLSGDNVDENGKLTDTGLTNVALYIESINASKQKIADIQAAIVELDKEKANGTITQEEYNTKLEENLALQRQEAASIKASKDAIIDFKKQAIEAETKAMQENVAVKKEALEAEQNLHEYKESIEEKEKDISILQRKINALSLSTDRKDIALRLSLEQELTDAQKDLKETQYDHNIETQKTALDEELEDFEKAQDERINTLENSTEEQEKVIKEYLDDVKTDYKTVSENINTLANTYGLTLSAELTSPWTSAKTAAKEYKEYLEKEILPNIKFDGTTLNTTTGKSAITSGTSTVTKDSLEKAVLGTSSGVNNSALAKSQGLSDLNQYVMGLGYDQLSYADMAKLASLLGITGVSATSITTAQKDAILTALKKVSGFTAIPVTSQYAGLVSSIIGDIKYGQTGANVKALQTALKLLNYDIGSYGVDGKFGDDTLAAVKKFQHDTGINSDGIVGDDTKKQFKLKGYKSGIEKLLEDELAWTQENGTEFITRPSSNAILTPLQAGDGVLNADLTKNLTKWGELNPADFIKASSFITPRFNVDKNNQINNMEINSPLVTISGVTRDEINSETQKMINQIPKDLMKALRQNGVNK